MSDHAVLRVTTVGLLEGAANVDRRANMCKICIVIGIVRGGTEPW